MHPKYLTATLAVGLAMASQLACAGNDEVPGAPPAVAERQWQPFWAKRVTGYIKAADGTELRYSVLLPKAQGKFPVLVRYSGYDTGSIGGAAYLGDNETFSVALDKQLVEQGYAVMGVSARGTGCSQGTFDFLGPRYGTDGRDAIDFAAAQSWSDGKVGMFGWSWAGMSQLMTASERPKALKAIAPGMVLGDARADSWAPGGVPAPEFVTSWHWFVDQRWEAVKASAKAEGDQRCLAQVAQNQADVVKHSLTYQLARHPLRDDWVKQRSPRDRTQRIQVPVLSMQTWQDEAVMAREGYYQDTLKPEQLWMVQSNGPHNLYEATRFREKLLAFFDHFVKGVNNGFESKPHMEVWEETTAERQGGRHEPNESARPGWTFERDRYPLAVTPVSFSLGAQGSLAQTGQPAGPADEYDYPVPGPEVNTYLRDNAWGPQDPRFKGGSLAYTSAPLQRDLVTYGSASADVWLSAVLVPDLDVQVTVTQVLPDGQEMYVQRGWLRLSSRQQDPRHATSLRPWRLDEPDALQPLLPDQPVLARVELPPFSQVLRQGSRLRLWIDAPSRTGGYGFDTFSLPAHVKVLHDAAHPSRLLLGTLADVKVPVAQPACGTLLKQPCRPDPLP
ncbi:CocE/NonD family hydrolase [Pseudomonas sp. RIT-PI-S]|uniref:CocE/NonD family hydrolase n=1 Tax=Pseudomonas sp. RIT-PI-S TaxID=3035295 RepID=UPI0021D8C18D|nr:CocE/NonD family hydrolase [Pseudomonas sp. RIT-PI-S]